MSSSTAAAYSARAAAVFHGAGATRSGTLSSSLLQAPSALAARTRSR